MSKRNWVKRDDGSYYNLDHFYCLKVSTVASDTLFYVQGFLLKSAVGEDGDSERWMSGYYKDICGAERALEELLSDPEDYEYKSIPSD